MKKGCGWFWFFGQSGGVAEVDKSPEVDAESEVDGKRFNNSIFDAQHLARGAASPAPDGPGARCYVAPPSLHGHALDCDDLLRAAHDHLDSFYDSALDFDALVRELHD